MIEKSKCHVNGNGLTKGGRCCHATAPDLGGDVVETGMPSGKVSSPVSGSAE